MGRIPKLTKEKALLAAEQADKEPETDTFATKEIASTSEDINETLSISKALLELSLPHRVRRVSDYTVDSILAASNSISNSYIHDTYNDEPYYTYLIMATYKSYTNYNQYMNDFIYRLTSSNNQSLFLNATQMPTEEMEKRIRSAWEKSSKLFQMFLYKLPGLSELTIDDFNLMWYVNRLSLLLVSFSKYLFQDLIT